MILSLILKSYDIVQNQTLYLKQNDSFKSKLPHTKLLHYTQYEPKNSIWNQPEIQQKNFVCQNRQDNFRRPIWTQHSSTQTRKERKLILKFILNPKYNYLKRAYILPVISISFLCWKICIHVLIHTQIWIFI